MNVEAMASTKPAAASAHRAARAPAEVTFQIGAIDSGRARHCQNARPRKMLEVST